MKTHADIDARSLAMARAIVARIDADPARAGVERARATCRRWLARQPSRAVQEWQEILEGPWPHVRAILLDESEEGRRRRQNSPFCGVLPPAQRLAIYKEFADAPR